MQADLDIPDYKITRELGRGGAGAVYEAVQTATGRIVALKVLRHTDSETDLKRFRLEARATAQLKHENVVAVYAFGTTGDGRQYIVMEHLDGINLSIKIAQSPLSVPEFVSIFSQVCAGLQAAHTAGIIHRDIKPANIFLLQDGNIKILDFGIATFASLSEEMRLTKTNCSIGTPLYMSPEQALGKGLDAASDLYSLGCVMYEALSGEPPVKGVTDFDIALKKQSELPDSIARRRKDLPPYIARAVDACLSIDKSDRPASAQELAERLHNRFTGTTSGARHPRLTKSQSLSLALSLSALIVVSSSVFILSRQSTTTIQSEPNEYATFKKIEEAADLLNDAHDYKQSTKAFLEILPVVRAQAKNDTQKSTLRYALYKTAASLQAQNRYKEAIPYFEEAWLISAEPTYKTFGKDQLHYVERWKVGQALAEAHATLNDAPKAESIFMETLSLLNGQSSRGSETRGFVMGRVSHWLSTWQRPQEAEQYAIKAQKDLNESIAKSAFAQSCLQRALLLQGKPHSQKALHMVAQSLENSEDDITLYYAGQELFLIADQLKATGKTGDAKRVLADIVRFLPNKTFKDRASQALQQSG